MNENPARLRVVTYNIHKCVGLDRLRRPERVIKVLKEIAEKNALVFMSILV
jgi:endonuclease/exonuclease/phosphatase family metal-dependent hydrolase